MMTIGIYEGKTHFSEFVERAAKGEKIRVTKNGKRMVLIVPDVEEDELDVEQLMQEIRELRKEVKQPILKPGETWREFIHEGHRY